MWLQGVGTLVSAVLLLSHLEETSRSVQYDMAPLHTHSPGTGRWEGTCPSFKDKCGRLYWFTLLFTPVGQNLVRWPHLAAKEAGICGFW